jgi:hypothetical protein
MGRWMGMGGWVELKAADNREGVVKTAGSGWNVGEEEGA